MFKTRRTNKAPRIGINIDVANVKEKTGISRHVMGLVSSVADMAPEIDFFLYYQWNPWSNADTAWIPSRNNIIQRPIWFPKAWLENRPRLWFDFYLPLRLWLDKIDLYHGPNHLIPTQLSIPTVVTIHDIAFFFMTVHGKDFDQYLARITLKSMQNADRIIAVSRSTAKDCISQGIAEDKFDVVYQGVDRNGVHKQKSMHSFAPETAKKIGEKYILSIGTLQPRKNLLTLLKAFERISVVIPHNLVLAGPPGSDSAEIENFINTNNLNQRVFLLGYISDEEKELLLENAEVFVYPSLYEGFGLVILEAFSHGIPVVTGNNSSLPEAAGDAAILVDVTKIDEIASAIKCVISDSKVREDLSQRGYEHLKFFSWEKCALDTIDVYKRVLGK